MEVYNLNSEEIRDLTTNERKENYNKYKDFNTLKACQDVRELKLFFYKNVCSKSMKMLP